MNMLATMGGMQVFEDPKLTEHDGYFFPMSPHRSKRIFKKLMKRFGAWERRKPAAYVMGNKMFAHPAIMAQIRAESKCTATITTDFYL